jgi:hypothetical protein
MPRRRDHRQSHPRIRPGLAAPGEVSPRARPRRAADGEPPLPPAPPEGPPPEPPPDPAPDAVAVPAGGMEGEGGDGAATRLPDTPRGDTY